MIRLKSLILSTAITFAALGSSNAQQYFRPFDGKQAPSSGKQFLVPEKYQLFTAGNPTLKSYLHQLKSGPASGQSIILPQPDGSSRIFKIWKSSILQEPLQSKYPDVETFTAVAMDDANVTAKIDFTSRGFHAMVYNGSATYLIDPYTDATDGYYLVYYKKDYHRSISETMSCGVINNELADGNGNLPETMDGSLPDLGAKQFGSTQRTFRLALSCTGEYAVAVGGSIPTKISVLSAMVTSMNRVNGIYEREVGVTMNLIGNNDTLIYLNPNTDPFTANNDGGTLLSQNSQNTGNVIGSANYDIGHIFSTGGGGVAFLGCVCRNQGNIKARGVTGSANPVGDAYDVDYVAHEMGHQFGADHTFNRCSGTEEQSAAYEPGSGSTIMAYAGICGGNNLQAHSNDYFHIKSLDQISDFLINDAACAVTSVGQTPPILPVIEDTFFIPYKTPFELQSPTATTESSDSLKYCWEQWDLGNYQSNDANAATFTSGPSFRSYSPTFDRMRVFPNIDSLVNNKTSIVGEKLPEVARSLHFKSVARNMLNGFGAFDFSDNELTLNVINTGVPFEITVPNTAIDSVIVDGTLTVTWNIAQTDVAPISTPNVDIFLSVDGGYTYPYTLATGVPNNGSFAVTMPDTVTTKARVKVKGAGNVFFDISNANFKIYSSGLAVKDIQLDKDLNVYPNPTTDFIHVENKSSKTLNLALYNVLGQKVWNGSMKQTVIIPVQTFSSGIYYLQLMDDNSGARTVKPVSIR